MSVNSKAASLASNVTFTLVVVELSTTSPLVSRPPLQCNSSAILTCPLESIVILFAELVVSVKARTPSAFSIL